MERRKKLQRFEHPSDLRFLTFSCYQRLPLFANDAIKDVFVEQIIATRHRHPFELFAWVIMPEHVHMLLRPAMGETVAAILLAMKRQFSARVLQRWRKLEAPALSRLRSADGAEHFWQSGGGYDRNINSDQERDEKLRYTHENPVRRGLVTSSIDWRWSSARWYLDATTYFGPAIDPLPR